MPASPNMKDRPKRRHEGRPGHSEVPLVLFAGHVFTLDEWLSRPPPSDDADTETIR